MCRWPLGYAQPVGGVIAYEEHVSVSGVGFDIGCGNMAVSGIESAKSAESLYSTIHGAGRVMSRTEARGKRNRKTGEVLSAGGSATRRCRHGSATAASCSRAPTSTRPLKAYRRLLEVLACHEGTVKIEHTLRPFAVVMAGADVFDPFKD